VASRGGAAFLTLGYGVEPLRGRGRNPASVHLQPQLFLRNRSLFFFAVNIGETGLHEFAMPLLDGEFFPRSADTVPELLYELQAFEAGSCESSSIAGCMRISRTDDMRLVEEARSMKGCFGLLLFIIQLYHFRVRFFVFGRALMAILTSVSTWKSNMPAITKSAPCL
jgi:hypothetical protein